MLYILFFLLFSISICHADTPDKHTQQTSEYGDEGKFGGGDPGNTNALILWSGDSTSIVRRHRPDGHSKSTPKAIKLWNNRGAGGFPVNMKSAAGFCSFLSKIDREPDLHACICDDTGAWDTGNNINCSPPVNIAQCTPAACDPGSITPGQQHPSCTVTDWSPETDTVCTGDSFDQSRTLSDCTTETRITSGSKYCPSTCPVTDWTPAAGSVCQGNSFKQVRTNSDCSTETRTVTGTKNCQSCTFQDWTPAASSVCLGDSFTQSRTLSDCTRETRSGTGTKSCSQTCPLTNWSPSPSLYCTSDQFTQTHTLSDCTIDSRTIYGTKNCPPSTCQYQAGAWSGPDPASLCDYRTATQTRTVTVTNQPCVGGTRPPSSRTVSGTMDCSRPTCRWSTGPWAGPIASTICQGSAGTQTRQVTLLNSPCEGGTEPVSSQPVSGTMNCRPQCQWSTGSWSPSPATVCDYDTLRQARTVTLTNSPCQGGTEPASSQTVSGTKNCGDGGVVDPPITQPPPARGCPSGYHQFGNCAYGEAFCCNRVPGPQCTGQNIDLCFCGCY